eukprot:CAMPEP_0179032782 /NCGR_PEP_ID=MMETSP0796-20121207/11762_1 /TAXON_ID=73915 /ORGANISM="Pyrodinium bahamense, Strain pbaha01" /LENGTH=129 /DNA_ID=CAMNT_0020729013 /DNA_START=188 /DNA_END=577 /DNA_ORIENTATION=-
MNDGQARCKVQVPIASRGVALRQGVEAAAPTCEEAEAPTTPPRLTQAEIQRDHRSVAVLGQPGVSRILVPHGEGVMLRRVLGAHQLREQHCRQRSHVGLDEPREGTLQADAVQNDAIAVHTVRSSPRDS